VVIVPTHSDGAITTMRVDATFSDCCFFELPKELD
jgi:hypothetical protein